MASGQELVDRILRSYNVEFDSTVSGKLNEFMVRSTIDLLKSAKKQSLYARKKEIGLIDIREAISQMKESKGVTFDQIASLVEERKKNQPNQNESVSIYEQLFQEGTPQVEENNLITYSLKSHFSPEAKLRIEQAIEEDKKRLHQKRNLRMDDIFTYEAKQKHLQEEQLGTQTATQNNSMNNYPTFNQPPPKPDDDDDNYE